MAESESDPAAIAGAAGETREERLRAGAIRKEEAVRAHAARLPRHQPGLGSDGSPVSIETVQHEIADSGFARPSEVVERLKAFRSAQVLHVKRLMGRTAIGPWPPIAGVLAVLFTSRSGSTHLARELECIFAIGRLRESLNLQRGKGQTPSEIVKGGADAWFSFKAGSPGVIAAELSGFFDAYLERTSFILLVRKDIVAQAVSAVKAKQTGQWHSNQTPQASPIYDGALIAKYVAVIADGVERLRFYAHRSGRPRRVLLYEDLAEGDLRKAEEACDALGVPRRDSSSSIHPMPVERTGDAVNEAWGARFWEEMDSSVRDCIERYLAEI